MNEVTNFIGRFLKISIRFDHNDQKRGNSVQHNFMHYFILGGYVRVGVRIGIRGLGLGLVSPILIIMDQIA
jgi:hypothetical protein